MTRTFGYSRLPPDTGPELISAEQRELLASGCDANLVFIEQASVAERVRPIWQDLLTKIHRGDQLVVPSFHRLAADLKDLALVLNDLHLRGVSTREFAWGIDTSTDEGRLFVRHLAPLIDFDGQLRRERQREGTKRARLAGNVLGRTATARQQSDQVVALRGRGMTISQIAASLSIGTASVTRILRAHRETAPALGDSQGRTSPYKDDR